MALLRGFLLICAVLVCSVVSLPLAADEIEDFYSARGTWATVTDDAVGPGGDFTIFTPADPGQGGFKHPVITWGNGTLSSPDDYFELLDHFASHGFVVIASNSGFVGSGVQMIDGAEWVLEQNDNPDSPLFGNIDVDSVGATGHSQGGGGTINAGNDPRITCLAPLQGTSGDIKGITGPLFSMAGETDFIVPWEGVAEDHFIPSEVPSIFGVLAGSGHLEPSGDGGRYRGYTTAWFAACLMEDSFARGAFVGECTLCQNENWRVVFKSGL